MCGGGGVGCDLFFSRVCFIYIKYYKISNRSRIVGESRNSRVEMHMVAGSNMRRVESRQMKTRRSSEEGQICVATARRMYSIIQWRENRDLIYTRSHLAYNTAA